MARTLYSVAACDDVADKIVNSLTGVGISPAQITLLRRLKAHKDAATSSTTLRCVTADHDSYFVASGLTAIESKPYKEALADGRIVIALNVGGSEFHGGAGESSQSERPAESGYISLDTGSSGDKVLSRNLIAVPAI